MSNESGNKDKLVKFGTWLRKKQMYDNVTLITKVLFTFYFFG